VKPRRGTTALLLLLLAAACAAPRVATRPAAAPTAPAAAAGDPGLPAERPARGLDDPWPAMAQALRARRLLDSQGEVQALLLAAAASPEGPAALVAVRRLSELTDESPERAAQVDAGLARLEEGGGLRGLGAYRARVARALAAEALGDHAGAARQRGENGAVTAWTLAGPFSELRVLDFDRPIPPEAGVLPAEVPAPAGLPAYPTRAIPSPDGTLALEGEPPGGDVYALAAEAALSRGGRYLLAVNTGAAVRVLLDGALVHERRSFAAWLPSSAYVPLELTAGQHRLLVKLSRTDGAGALAVSLARADGDPSDASWSAPPPGTAPPSVAARPQRGAPAGTARELAQAMEKQAGPVLARLLAARDALSTDRAAAKALLTEALELAPGSASVQVALADARDDDPTLDRQAGQARAEAALREALRTDPGHAEARVLLARILRASERYDAAEEVLAAIPAPASGRPLALAARARCAEDRGLSERAEALAGEAIAAGGSCEASELALGLALRQQALARVEESLALSSRCRGGREREARQRLRRGDAAGAGAALEPYLAARPWDIDAGLQRAEALVADGQARAAAGRIAGLAVLWPRSPRIQVALASALELSGDAAGARTARERALLLDGGDLDLRRALALEDGREVLDDLTWDARSAIRDYEAAGRRNGTSSVMVLDAAAVDIHPGAVATERTQQVIHVIDQAGVEKHGEVSLPAGAQVIAARTLKPDGRALEPDRTSDEKGSLSLSGLEPGDYVQLDYVRAVRAPFGTLGYAADAFYFQAARERLFRSTYAVRAPAGAGLEVDAHGMPAPGVVSEGGSELVRAELRDVPPAVPEPAAPAMGEYMPWLVVGTGAAREAFQRGFADRMEGRTLPTEELAAFAKQIRAEAPGSAPMALARAAYARVARTILGDGPFFEDASQVLSRGRGSRLLVLKAVLELLGLEARVAVVRPYGADPGFHRFPNPGLYSSPLLRVRAGAEVAWLDPSTRQNPFGAIPGWLTGCEALVLPQAGEPPLVDRTPERAAEEDGHEISIRVVLAADGAGELSGTDRYRGVLGAMLKAQLEPLDPTQRRQALEAMLSKSFQGIALAELTFEGEDDPAAPLAIRWKGRARIARPDGAGLLIEAGPLPARLGARYVRLASRTTPLLLASPERSTLRLELVPPPGLQAAAEPPARLESSFGSYLRTDAPMPQGGGLVREERLEVARGRIPPERYRDFAAFAASVDGLQEGPIRLTP
jgi:cellulose synthase operon protein C